MRLVGGFLIFVLLVCDGLGHEEIIIKIKNGNIRGMKMTSEKGNDFYSFRGIPYAEPPVDDLRFRAPIDKKPWGDDVLNATEDGPVCPQIDFATRTYIGQEDNCLVLNVYSPELPNENNFNHRAVMVFIHGGAFVFGMGSSSFYNPRSMIDNDIVLVTINYRLGPLGFLSTGDENAPGNYGLLDQTKALEWVKENIAVFGGDTERITIFGESAGGASVVYQVISPLSKGLFHRAIAMSGSSLCIWAFQDYPLIRAQMLGIKFPCPLQDKEKLVKCLREASAKDLMQYAFEFTNNGLLPVIFAPNVDNNFLTDTPDNIVSSGKFNKDISFMSGITKDEGAFLYAVLNPTSSILTEDNVQEFLESIVGASIHTEQSVKMIREKYMHDADITNEKEMRKTLVEIFSQIINHCHYKTAKLVSQVGIDAFAYQYDYSASFSSTQACGIRDIFGVSHFDDMFMLFDGLFMPVNMTEKDKKMRSTFQKLLTNFAKYGHPTHKDSEVKFLQWQPIKKDQLIIYHINDPITSGVYNPDSSYEFWTRDIPEAMKTPFIKAKDEL